MKPTTVLFTALALTLCGCSSDGPTHQPTEKYFLVCTNSKIPYWQEAGAGFTKAAGELRIQAEMVGPETYDPNAEREEFKRVVSKNPAGILVSPGNPEVLKPEIDAAIAAGIPVITIDSDAPQSQRLFFVGTNNFQAGQMGGRLLGKLLDGKGTAVFYTIIGQRNLEERMNGYRAALESFPGIKIVETVDMKGDPRIAFDKTMEITDKNKDVTAFVALEALSGAEIAEVVKRKNLQGKTIVAMDTAANTLEHIQSGTIAATIMQKPYTMGYYGLKALADIVLRKPKTLIGSFATDPKSPYPALIDTGTMLVDRNNLSEIKK